MVSFVYDNIDVMKDYERIDADINIFPCSKCGSPNYNSFILSKLLICETRRLNSIECITACTVELFALFDDVHWMLRTVC